MQHVKKKKKKKSQTRWLASLHCVKMKSWEGSAPSVEADVCGWEEEEVVEEWGCGKGEEEVEAYMHLEKE